MIDMIGATNTPATSEQALATTMRRFGGAVDVGAAYLARRLDVPRERLIDHLTALHLAAAGVTSGWSVAG